MTSKQRRTKGKQRSYKILDAGELSALNRFVEHHGAPLAAEKIGIGVSTLYNSLQPGAGMRPDTLDLIRKRISASTTNKATTNGATIKMQVEVELSTSDTLELMRACATQHCAPDEWLARLALGSLRDGVE